MGTTYRPDGATHALTARDYQAMYNFSKEGITHKSIAENFGCDVAIVADVVKTRPWLSSKNNATVMGQDTESRTWWQSTHTDSLELVKMYYPQYLPEGVPIEIGASEMHGHEFVPDYDRYYEREGIEYGSLRYDMDSLFKEEVN